MAMRGETRISTATVKASLDTELFEPIELSLEAVNLAVLFILNIFNQLRWLRTNVK